MNGFDHAPLSNTQAIQRTRLSLGLILVALIVLIAALVAVGRFMISIYEPPLFGFTQVAATMLLAVIAGICGQVAWNLRVELRLLNMRDIAELQRMLRELDDRSVSTQVLGWIDDDVPLRGRDLLAVSKLYHRTRAESETASQSGVE